MKKTLNIFCLILLLTVGCKKNQVDLIPQEEINPITYKTFEEQKLYIYKNIKIVTTELAKAMKKIEVRKLVDSKAKEKKSGDYNVLISDLMKFNIFTDNLDLKKIEEGISAFNGIEGKNMNLAVYIPRIAYQETHKNIVTFDNSEVPEYVIPNGDENEIILDGWVLNQNQDLILSGNSIDENYANTNPIYLIYLQEENFNSQSNSNFTPHISIDDIYTYPPPIDPNSPFSLNVKIEKMGIKELKEAWWKGCSEVAIRAILLTWNGKVDGNSGAANVDYQSARSNNDFRGINIFNFPRVSIENIPIDVYQMKFNLQSNWNVSEYFTKPIIYAYTIFEADDWPSAIHTDDIYPFRANLINDTRLVKYRSGDNSYYNGSFHSTNDGWSSGYTPTQNVVYYNNGTIKQIIENNNSIKYNIIQY